MVKKKGLIEKKNTLNEVRKNNMSLQELRFFSIYLSKINARDVTTRRVRFPLYDFRKIMEFGRLNTAQIKDTTDRLLGKVISVPTERGGYTSFQLFKKCTVDKDDYGDWFVEIDAHDDALPLMFDFKKEYFTYELWNALRLRSGNQLRMYEMLKQYEKIGERKMTLTEIRNGIGISDSEYPRWDRFKERVIDSCRQALAENTDIKFSYKPIKSGKGGKITAIHFFIQKNENYKDPLSLEDFIDDQKEIIAEADCDIDSDAESRRKRRELCFGLEGEIFNEFTYEQLVELTALAKNNVVLNSKKVDRLKEVGLDEADMYEYLVSEYIQSKILKTNAMANIENRYSYIKAAVANDYD